MSGTGTLIARIAQQYEPNVKIGIGIRETLSASPKSSYMVYNFGAWNRAQMYNRLTDGGVGSVMTNTVLSGSPMWLKLVRSGTTFTGYASTDGATWVTIGSQNISMGANCYAGMVVCANRTAAPATKIWFDNISLTIP